LQIFLKGPTRTHLLSLIRSRGKRYRRQPSASRNTEQWLRQLQNDSNETAEENADRGKGDLEEGAEEAMPPRVLVLGAGPLGFSAIFSSEGSGGDAGGLALGTRGTGMVDP
jgi:hypothetical protein